MRTTMRTTLKFCLALVLALASTMLLGVVTADAQEAVGTVTASSGDARLQRPGELDIHLAMGVRVFEGDTIVTGPEGRAMVLFEDRCRISVGPETQLVIDEYLLGQIGGERRSVFRLLWGRVRVLIGEMTGTRTESQVVTPTAVAGVTGTYFIVEHDPVTDQTTVFTLSGLVHVFSLKEEGEGVDLMENEVSRVRPRRQPTPAEAPEDDVASRLILNTSVREEVESSRMPGHPGNLGDDPLRGLPGDASGYDPDAQPQRAAEGEAGTDPDAFPTSEDRDTNFGIELPIPSETTPASVTLQNPPGIGDDDVGDDDDDDFEDEFSDVTVIIDLDPSKELRRDAKIGIRKK